MTPRPWSRGATAAGARLVGTVLARIRAVAHAVSDALFDPRCAAGDHPLGQLVGPTCADCEQRLQQEGEAPRCPQCSAARATSAPCGECAMRPRRVPVHAPRGHAGVARALVLSLKGARREDVAVPLARATAADARVRDCLARADVIVPVPAHPVRRRERGFNQAEAIARALAGEARAKDGRARPVVDALLAAPLRGKQAARAAAARRRTLRGTMRVRRTVASAVRARHVVLVDDVITTGATVAEAARVLLDGGAAAVEVVACTRAPGILLDAPRASSREARS